MFTRGALTHIHVRRYLNFEVSFGVLKNRYSTVFGFVPFDPVSLCFDSKAHVAGCKTQNRGQWALSIYTCRPLGVCCLLFWEFTLICISLFEQ